MNRREAIKVIPMLGLSAAWFTSCKNESVANLSRIKISTSHFEMLQSIAQGILPGFNAGDVDKFNKIIRFIDKTIPTKDISSFTTGVAHLETELKANYNLKNQQLAQEDFLTAYERFTKTSDDKTLVLEVLKKAVLKFYTTEENYMAQVLKYKFVPGEFSACITI